MHVCILLGNSFGQLVSPRLSLSKMVQFVQCHCIQAHLSVKHLGLHSQINHVERAESIRMCFFLRKEYLRHGIPTGTDSQQLGQQCGAITLVFESVKKNIEIYRKCKKNRK